MNLLHHYYSTIGVCSLLMAALGLSLTAGARDRVFPSAGARAEAWRGAELVSTPTGERLTAAEGSESNFWAGVRYVFPRGLDLSRRARIVAPVSNLTARPLSFNLHLQSDRWQGELRCGHLTLPPFGAGEITCDLRGMPWRLDTPAEFPGMRGSLSPTGGSLFDLRHVDAVRVVRDYGNAAFVVNGLYAEDAERQADAKVLPLKTFFPFVDRFGQFRHDTWPGKARDESDLAKDRAEEDAWLKTHGESPIPDVDRFGGWAGGPQLKSTGFFRTEKVDGRWWLVDPDGRLFFSHGVDCVELTGNWTSTDGVRTNWFERLPASPAANPRPGAVYFYAENLVRKYGERAEDIAAARAHERMRAWGLNTIGNWSCPRVYGLARTPYVISVESPKRGQVDPLGRTIQLPDAFSPTFERDLSASLRRHAAKMRDDPWCLGVFVDNELGWGGFTNFLPLAERYYEVCERAVRRELPNHLYLGSRFAGGDASYHVAAARHCDVVSFNEYARTMGRDLPAGAADKPILIGEFHFGALDRGLFHTGLVPTASQDERARCYREYLASCLDHPRVVGAHWFQWIDQPLTGRGFDAENFQVGFLSVADRPYPELVDAARETARTMYRRRYGAKAGTERERVMFVVAHPDDTISCLGTCLLMKGRFDVHVVDFTHGERGLGEKGFLDGSTKATRIREEEAVCREIGATLHWLDQIDGESYVTPGTCRKLADLIERLKPRAVFGHWPMDFHMDHMMSAATLQKAVRMTGYRGEFYFFEVSFDSKGFQDAFYVDISAVAQEKERIIRLYECQNRGDKMCREEMRNSKGRAMRLWPPHGSGYAEAFAQYVGRPQGGKCIFSELPPDPQGGKMPSWGR